MVFGYYFGHACLVLALKRIIMPSTQQRQNRENAFSFISTRTWLRLLFNNRKLLEKHYRSHVFETTLTSALTAPLRFYERIRYNGKIAGVDVKSPLFILGFPRTGTTHLHNILSRDSAFGYVTTFQAVAPGFFLTGNKKIKPILAKHAPQKRSMDNVAINMDFPQEEDVALGNLSTCTYYHHLSLPALAPELRSKFILFEAISPAELKEWKKAYLGILKKATFYWNGKPLVLKSPPNTGRINILLELFPNAKFIHIHRNPYVVFNSLRNLYHKALPHHQLQSYTNEQVEEMILALFYEMMTKYIKDKELIPEGNLIEIAFADLEKNTLKELERIYEALSLPNFENAKPLFEKYLQSLGAYKKNRFELNKHDIEKVNNAWGFAFNEWKYNKL